MIELVALVWSLLRAFTRESADLAAEILPLRQQLAIVVNEAHLKRVLSSYFAYYHGSRAHMGLDGNSPEPREVEPPQLGPVVAIPHVGGLHHHYTRQAA